MSFLKKMSKELFGVDPETLFEVIEENHSAKGYIQGGLSELLFKKYMEKKNYDCIRIKEKPQGGFNAKSSSARGDFYVKKRDKNVSIEDDLEGWFVVECKGLKSNAEKHLLRNSLSSRTKIYNHLVKKAFKDKNWKEKTYEKGMRTYKAAKERWEAQNLGKNFPEFRWDIETPGADNVDLDGLWSSKDDLKKWIENIPDEMLKEEAFFRGEGAFSVLFTHAPSNRTSQITKIKQAAPLITDFNIMCVDTFLRTKKHEFVFMNSECISHSPSSPEHQYQNYYVDYLISGKKNKLDLRHPWYSDIEQLIEITKPTPRRLELSQIDQR